MTNFSTYPGFVPTQFNAGAIRVRRMLYADGSTLVAVIINITLLMISIWYFWAVQINISETELLSVLITNHDQKWKLGTCSLLCHEGLWCSIKLYPQHLVAGSCSGWYRGTATCSQSVETIITESEFFCAAMTWNHNNRVRVFLGRARTSDCPLQAVISCVLSIHGNKAKHERQNCVLKMSKGYAI